MRIGVILAKLRMQATYHRLGNQTVRFNLHYTLLTICAVVLCVLFFYEQKAGSKSSSDTYALSRIYEAPNYNAVYPLTRPSTDASQPATLTYRIALVADLDTKSRHVKKDGSVVWRSYLKYGRISYASDARKLRIEFDDVAPSTLESGYALKGRGMELSELVTFNGRLLTFDDRTGIVYEYVDNQLVPWVLLVDGNGLSAKGYKSEWATVKDQTLYVGSMGKEWTSSSGEFVNNNPMYVKAISASGAVHSIDWSDNYKALRAQAMHIAWPGYMIHESGVWSDAQQRWYFLPRRCSKERYNETSDELLGCNLLISADSSFKDIQTVTLKAVKLHTTLGFSSFKFLPNTNDEIIVALLSSEFDGRTATYVIAFDIRGQTLYPLTKIPTEYKYEGLEFI